MTVNSGVTAVVERFVVQNGSGWGAGGIHNVGGAVTLNSSVVRRNSGGISNGGAMTLNHSMVSSNTSIGFAGGIANSGVLTLNNSDISDNSTTATGGGISSASGSTVILNNSSVTSNSSLSYSGGYRKLRGYCDLEQQHHQRKQSRFYWRVEWWGHLDFRQQ